MSYWRHAREWAFENTKTYTLPKAIPPILAALGQWYFFGMRPINQTVFTVVTIIGGYVFLYWAEFTWKLLFKAPAVLDQERIQEIEKRDKQAVQNREQIQSLLGENADLRRPRRSNVEQVRLDVAEQCIGQMIRPELVAIRELAEKEEIRLDDLHRKMVDSGTMTEVEWSEMYGRWFRGHRLIEVTRSEPGKPFPGVRITPEYRNVVLEILHRPDATGTS
jgi:hypothetical protein